ncbi:MAG: glucosaminidase domain-containing protein [Gammaproteobacteria bacterium]
MLPLVAAGVIVWQSAHLPRPPEPPLTEPQLIPLKLLSAATLENVFTSQDYSWPPQGDVPPYAVTSLPYGINTLDPEEKKSVFFRALLPLVLAENQRIWNQRAYLLQQFGQGRIERDSLDGAEVAALAEDYKISGNLNAPQTRTALLDRVDTVPTALVLAQAAQESGWGTSRFALEANNLFGVWTWDSAQGSVPVNRPGGANHLVRIYPDLQSSIRAYLYNINVGFAYVDFRKMRAAMRASGRPLNALDLAGSLNRYSITGDLYIQNIRSMILGNGLGKLTDLTLANPSE